MADIRLNIHSQTELWTFKKQNFGPYHKGIWISDIQSLKLEVAWAVRGEAAASTSVRHVRQAG